MVNIYHAIPELETTNIVTAGVSLRHGGVSRSPYASLNLAEHVGDDPNAVAANRAILFQKTGLTDLRYCRQIHGTDVINVVDQALPTSTLPPEADALVTAQRDIALAIFTADCVPIFIVDVTTPAIGIAHAGWRGTLARIAVNTLARMETLFGTIAANCQIHLGPSIQKCCYTVSAELLTQFTDHFGSTVASGTNLSLQSANVNQLVQIGLPTAAISVSPFCTACRTDLFYSHRAEDGQTGRMLSFIQLNIKS
ncbi:peptidoglycan editing factor PgeF [Candidatus Poribacteria bacterium]|nr:peptidoglycan editing factor PgeF [Candidatus Poribacteria bacterium]MYG06488.1 peptidoglycan editing factor PgeF [Candidatus Poribacteria bacterium]MYK23384.1 peptidoglycan editing factor PgeF [Candidatus Poribacteria bacterium]